MAFAYEVYSYGDVEALQGIFNGVAATMGAQGYAGALALALAAGFLVAGLAYAFMPHRHVGWWWLFSITCVFVILLTPKADVIVVDRLGGSPPRVVANIPFGLAWFASATSSVGDALTELFETAFSTVASADSALPAELAYQKTGMVFGNRIVEKTREVVFHDPEFRANLVNFMNNCLFFDLADGTIDPKTFGASPDVWPLMANTNLARFSTLSNGGNVITATCRDVYANLNQRLPTQIANETNLLARLLNPALPAAMATGLLAQNQIAAGYQRLAIADASVTAAQLIRQNAMINAIRDGTLLLGQQSNDSAALLLSVAKSQGTASANSSYLAGAAVAEEALPILRNVAQGLVFALFPLMILGAILTSGKTTAMLLTMYAALLIWIQLWPPIYAVINYLATLASAKHLGSTAVTSLDGAGNSVHALSLSTADAIYSGTISDMAVTAYLVTLVPVIAGALVWGLHRIAPALMSGLNVAVQTAGSAASAAAAGNLSMGNVSTEQQALSPSRADPMMQTYTSGYGKYTTSAVDGSFLRFKENVSSGAVKIEDSQAIQQSMTQASAMAETSAEMKSRQAAASIQSSLDTILTHEATSGSGTSGTFGMNLSDRTAKGTKAAVLNQVAIDLGRDLGIKDTSQARSAITLSLGVGNQVSNEVSGAARTGPGGAFDKAIRTALGGKVGVDSTGQQITSNDISAAITKAERTLRNAGITNSFDVVQDYVESDRFERLKTTNQGESDRVSANYSKARSLADQAGADWRRSKEYREMADQSERVRLAIASDNGNQFYRFVHQEFLPNRGLNMADWEDANVRRDAIAAYMGSGFFRQGENGNMTFSLVENQTPPMRLQPGSFVGGLSSDYAAHAKRLTPPTIPQSAVPATDHAANRDKLHSLSPNSAAGSGRTPLTPEAIQTRGAALNSQVREQTGDARNEVVDKKSELQQKFQIQDTSIFHALGDQPNGMFTDDPNRGSAAQQLEHERKRK